jgi:hypothetical protein
MLPAERRTRMRRRNATSPIGGSLSRREFLRLGGAGLAGMAEQFNLSLKGETDPQAAVQSLQEELTKIVEQGS